MVFLVAAASAAVTAAVLAVKVYRLKKGIRQTGDSLAAVLSEDTNMLISVTSDDRDVMYLASELNRQLRKLAEERHVYRQGDRELKEAVTNISHDVRTPLTAVCGYFDLLEKLWEKKTWNTEDMEKAERYFAVIRNRLDSINRLTEELFRYSVILSEDVSSLSCEKICLNSFLEESIIALYAVLEDRNIHPEIDITEKRIVVCADRGSVQRIFSNILGNAARYSDGDLYISLDDEGTVRFSNHAENLSQVQVNRLFDRFYTVEEGRKTTGLGLSIARTLVERNGGEIGAEYRNGMLTVTVSFAVQENENGSC